MVRRHDPHGLRARSDALPECAGTMKVVGFLTEYAVVGRIIHHLKLTFVAEKPPSSHHCRGSSETFLEFFQPVDEDRQGAGGEIRLPFLYLHHELPSATGLGGVQQMVGVGDHYDSIEFVPGRL